MSDSIIKQAKILIVDDMSVNVRLLEAILENAGFSNIHSTTDSRQALPLFLSIQPDILLLDVDMPYLDGFDVIRQVKPRMGSRPIPIVVLTADATAGTKHRALNKGASDFVTKPLDQTEVLLRIQNLLESYFHRSILEARVAERTQDLEKAQLEILQRLALAAEYRDDNTGMHTKRVGDISAKIAEAMGLDAGTVDCIRLAAPLHDVGKIGVPDSVLLKPGKLTSDEFETMKLHTVIGTKILAGSTSPLLNLAEDIALSHHERWDGRGYMGLTADDIPLCGRIVSVADVFDALTHERPYKAAWPVEDAVAEIEKQSGIQFDPVVVEAFLTLPHADLI